MTDIHLTLNIGFKVFRGLRQFLTWICPFVCKRKKRIISGTKGGRICHDFFKCKLSLNLKKLMNSVAMSVKAVHGISDRKKFSLKICRVSNLKSLICFESDVYKNY